MQDSGFWAEDCWRVDRDLGQVTGRALDPVTARDQEYMDRDTQDMHPDRMGMAMAALMVLESGMVHMDIK